MSEELNEYLLFDQTGPKLFRQWSLELDQSKVQDVRFTQYINLPRVDTSINKHLTNKELKATCQNLFKKLSLSSSARTPKRSNTIELGVSLVSLNSKIPKYYFINPRPFGAINKIYKFIASMMSKIASLPIPKDSHPNMSEIPDNININIHKYKKGEVIISDTNHCGRFTDRIYSIVLPKPPENSSYVFIQSEGERYQINVDNFHIQAHENQSLSFENISKYDQIVIEWRFFREDFLKTFRPSSYLEPFTITNFRERISECSVPIFSLFHKTTF